MAIRDYKNLESKIETMRQAIDALRDGEFHVTRGNLITAAVQLLSELDFVKQHEEREDVKP